MPRIARSISSERSQKPLLASFLARLSPCQGYHTLKSQLVADQNTEEIICVFCGKGRGHDFSLFKKSRVRFHPLTTSIEDSGYQGIAA